MSINTVPAHFILIDAYLTYSQVVLAHGYGSRGGTDLRIGDQVFTMSDGTDDDGNPVEGYAYTYGTLIDGAFVDESGAQWADTEADARAAVAAWVATFTS